jgi:HD-like signal output (HDOD) protein
MAAIEDLQTRLDQFVGRAGDLYTLPRVAAEVLELTRDAAVDTLCLKQCIEKDPALTAKLLRVVNSSLFGLCREVSDLNQALALLGIKPLKLLVLGFSLPEGLFRNVAADFLSKYWRHTLTTAVAAREICTLLKRSAGDEAFIAGLVKHLGMLVLVQQVGLPYVRFVERMQAHGMDLLDAERLALGFDHTQLTVRLLEHWRLPAAIVRIAGKAADETQPAEARQLHSVLNTADTMAVWLANPRIATLPSLQQSLRSIGSLKEGQFGALLVSLHDKVRQLASVLSLELPAQQSAEQLTLEAYRRLSESAACSAEEMLNSQYRGTPADSILTLDETSQLRRSFIELEAAEYRPHGNTGFSVEPGPIVPLAAPLPAATASADDRALPDEVAGAVSLCRRNRQPLALALVEIDRYGDLLARGDLPTASLAMRRWRDACQRLEHEWTICLDAGPGRLALLLMGCERQDATRMTRQLLNAAGETSTVSIGIAAMGQVPRNFPPTELLAAACRCLSGAQVSGGNCLKSIDL